MIYQQLPLPIKVERPKHPVHTWEQREAGDYICMRCGWVHSYPRPGLCRDYKRPRRNQDDSKAQDTQG